MAKGGKRKGAGRPKGSVSGHTLQAQEMRKRFIELALENWEALCFTLIDKAVSGDTPALRETFDRVLGKPVQPLAGSDDQGNILPFQIVISSTNGNNQDRTVSRAV
jgi:hypothetical protein